MPKMSVCTLLTTIVETVQLEMSDTHMHTFSEHPKLYQLV